MTILRYDLRQDPDGRWTVYKIATGAPAKIEGRFCSGLSQAEAEDLVYALNWRGDKEGGAYPSNRE